MKKSTVAVLGLAASVFALPAAAQMNMSAFYVGATLGQSKFKDLCNGVGGGISCDNKDTAWRILAGYQFTPNFAAEVGDVTLGEPLAADDLAAIRAAFTKYAVLVFPDQEFDDESQLDFARHFGPLETTVFKARSKVQQMLQEEVRRFDEREA